MNICADFALIRCSYEERTTIWEGLTASNDLGASNSDVLRVRFFVPSAVILVWRVNTTKALSMRRNFCFRNILVTKINNLQDQIMCDTLAFFFFFFLSENTLATRK